MRKLILAVAALAVAAPIAPAFADPPPWAPAHGRRAKERALTSRDVVWRGNDGGYYCRREDGTTGRIVGTAVDTVLGRTLDVGSQRILGTMLGGSAGAMISREIDRGELRCS